MKNLIQTRIEHSSSLPTIFTLFTLLCLFLSQTIAAQVAIYDTRDGQTYQAVELQDKYWMTTNLNYEVPYGKSIYFNNEPSNAAQHGRLYTWDAAQTACPQDWRLPTNQEIRQLARPYGGIFGDFRDDNERIGREAYEALIAGGGSGFNVSLSGYTEGNVFYGFEEYGIYWTKNKDADGGIYIYAFGKNDVRGLFYSTKLEYADGGFKSVRCVKDVELVRDFGGATPFIRPDEPEVHSLKVVNNSMWQIAFQVKTSSGWSDWEYVNSNAKGQIDSDEEFEGYDIQWNDLGTWRNFSVSPVLPYTGFTTFTVKGNTFTGISVKN